MEEKTYQLGNQPEEFPLSEKYLGWNPVGYQSWIKLISESLFSGGFAFPFKIDLTREENGKKVSIIVHQTIIKDAFPLSFFGEERAADWDIFAIVSKSEDPDKKFIIPLH